MAALVCREMGWTWDEFEAQPAWFIDVVLAMLQAEQDEKNKTADAWPTLPQN